MSTLVELFKVLRRRIPGRFLPRLGIYLSTAVSNLKLILTTCLQQNFRRNLRQLVDSCGDDPKNYPRAFWRWLKKQPWRKMLPELIESLGEKFTCVATYNFLRPGVRGCCHRRLDVTLQDYGKDPKSFVGKWHMMLPSDVLLDRKCLSLSVF